MKILVAVTGGIAAYKVCSLVSYLKSQEHEVKVVMTEAATKFVGEATFQALSLNQVYTDMFAAKDPTKVEHIELASWADVMVVAPATANTLAKLANGICDNLLTTVYMALPETAYKIICPAMNTNMWNSSAMQRNMSHIDTGTKESRSRTIIVAPEAGRLACGAVGIGKLADNKTIMMAVQKVKDMIAIERKTNVQTEG